MTARQAALAALERFRRGGEYSQDALDRAITDAGLDARDAALCSNICAGVIQNLYLLDFYISSFCDLPLGRLEPRVLDILRLSAYQLAFLDRVPPSAAVSEGVELCKRSCRRAAGLVNAVLRRMAERRSRLPEPEGRGTASYLSVRYSHPLWLAEELIGEHGYEFTEGFFSADNTVPPICAQTNTLRIAPDALRARLEARGVRVAGGAVTGALALTGAGRLTRLPEFLEGLFYVQDDAARMAVAAMGLEPGMNVLDVCAAPGGKSFAAAMDMGDRGRIVACDISGKKLQKISDGAARLGVSVIETRAMDARRPETELIGWADAVIADCPCSGLGVIRKKPEIRYKSPEELAGLPAIQLDILQGAADCVRPGGTLLYSTCTVRRRENEDVAEEFLARRPDFTLKEKMTAFWPHLQETDGFFICGMVKLI